MIDYEAEGDNEKQTVRVFKKFQRQKFGKITELFFTADVTISPNR